MLEPLAPTVDAAVHRALVAVYGALERQIAHLWQEDPEVIDRSYRELRAKHEAMWEDVD